MRIVATAGHVDHGKSSLVRALTGTDPDRLAEEKRRGLTIDLGFANTTLPSGAGISFVDVPGHTRFLRNMLAGVGAVDACLFVVAATEAWKPQSEEHLRILELLDITHGVVALTKADLVDDEWLQLAELDVRDHLAGTFLAEAPVVAVSATTGAGLTELVGALDALVASTPAAVDLGRARLWVDRAFVSRGSGTVVTGTLTRGGLTTDDQVVVGPGRRRARIRAIQTLGVDVERIGPGNRVALNLSGVELADIHRGDAVVHPGRWHQSARVDASLTVLAALGHEVSRKGAYAAYVGSGELSVRLRVLGAETAIAPGTDGLVRLHLAHPLPLLPGDRFVLRESGREETVGGGEVLDVAPVLAASKASPDRRVERVVAERGWIAADELELLTGERRAPDVGRWVAAPGALAAETSKLTTRIRDAGPLGLELATLEDRARAVLATMPDVAVDRGFARPAEAVDPLADHPVLALLARYGCSPPDADAIDGVDRATLRRLVRRGLLVDRDGVVFHPDAIDTAAQTAARLLAEHPSGFTVSHLREALGVTRKHALPLAAELDARGLTRRRDDRRVAGPRLSTWDDGERGE